MDYFLLVAVVQVTEGQVYYLCMPTRITSIRQLVQPVFDTLGDIEPHLMWLMSLWLALCTVRSRLPV